MKFPTVVLQRCPDCGHAAHLSGRCTTWVGTSSQVDTSFGTGVLTQSHRCRCSESAVGSSCAWCGLYHSGDCPAEHDVRRHPACRDRTTTWVCDCGRRADLTLARAVSLGWFPWFDGAVRASCPDLRCAARAVEQLLGKRPRTHSTN